MLACIGGHFTMDARGAALAASWVKPKALVPMHFGTFPVLPGTPDELRKAAGGTKVLVLEPGKPATFWTTVRDSRGSPPSQVTETCRTLAR